MGPLAGIKIVELAGIGPGPMCATQLSDLGATILRVERKIPAKLGIERPLKYNLLMRGRKQIAVDLKDPAGVEFVLKLVKEADGLIEGFRPGVTERLGLGPQECLARNPRLVYGRMTGWGQDGPLAKAAAHDLNYIAVTGALAAIGRAGHPPTPPLNIVGDYGGGGLYLALGMLAAILEARTSGQGQVVDAAICEGTAHLMTGFHGLFEAGLMTTERGTNLSDGGAPYYDCYECADGKYISIATVEAKFFDLLLEKLEFSKEGFPAQDDRNAWPKMRELFAAKFRERSREQWSTLLEGTDVCFAPVLDIDEAPHHPQMKSREVYVDIDGIKQPAPAPRFSRTVPDVPSAARAADETSPEDALEGWDLQSDVETWRARGTI